MLLVLDALAERPFLYQAANKAGIHPKTLAYWIRRSEAGDDGYDIEWEGIEWRFHEHCKSAIWEAEIKLLDRMFERALFGNDKVLTHRGRVVYKIDQGLVGLGRQGPDAYLRDENGNPVPETVRKARHEGDAVLVGVAPSRKVGQAPEGQSSSRGWRTCHRW